MISGYVCRVGPNYCFISTVSSMGFLHNTCAATFLATIDAAAVQMH